MKLLSGIILMTLILGSFRTCDGQTLVQNLLWITPPDYVLDKQFANEHWDVDLFCKPKSGGITHIISPSSGVVSKFAAFADPCWNRILYLEDNYPEIRAHGGPGTGTNQYRTPQSIKVYAANDNLYAPPNYSVYVCDNGNNRIQRLEYNWQQPQSGLLHNRYYTSPAMPSPVDFDLDNMGRFVPDIYNLLWVINKNNTLIALSAQIGALYAYYGGTGSGTGQFDSVVAIACGRNPLTNANDSTIYLADSGNSRIVKLRYDGSSVEWVKELWYPLTPFITDMATDPYGHLWAVTSHGRIAKFSRDLETLDEIPMQGGGEHQLDSPTCLAIAGGYFGSGGVMFSEKWTNSTGIKGFTIGTNVKDAYVNSFPNGSLCVADIFMRLTDISRLRVSIYKPGTGLIKTIENAIPDGEPHSSGSFSIHWNGRNQQNQPVDSGNYFVEIIAQSTYFNPYTEQFSATVYDTIEFTHCSLPCTWLVGDANGLGSYNISDGVYIIDYVFGGGPAPIPHSVGSGDADCNNTVSISDYVYLINFIFNSGPAPQCSCSQYR